MSLAIEQQIDYSFLRLPFEVIVKQFKTSRKQLEHDLTIALNQIIHINSINEAQLMIEKIQKIKKSLQDNTEKEKIYLDTYLQRLKTQDQTHECKLQRSIVDNLLREGYVSTAQKLIKAYQIENLTTIEQELILEANSILKDLKNKSVSLALKWCKQNDSKLKKLQSSFQNNLIFKQFIEYLKEDQRFALDYLRHQQHPLEQESLQKAMGCLLFIKQQQIPANYKIYFEEEQWDQLIRQFKKELYEIYCYPYESQFLSSLKCGISTLKTQYCDLIDYQQTNKCPICSQQMQELSKELLTTQKIGSTWICRISGELMDENNPPMMLPNHQVYSQRALQNLSEQMNGQVYCPITKDKFKYSDCIRVYLT